MKRPTFAPVRSPHPGKPMARAVVAKAGPAPKPRHRAKRSPASDVVSGGGWTPREIEKLRKGIADGYSYGQIRKRYLPKRSRNAIISKCHRLGIRERMTDGEQRARTSQHVNARNFAQRIRRGGSVKPQAEIIHLHAVPFDKLMDTSCRWPLGDPKSKHFGFCGCDAEGVSKGKPYCEAHTKIAFEEAHTPTRRARIERLAELDLAA